MISPKTKTEIDTLCENHKNNPNLPIRTNAVFITRDHFDAFRNNLPQDCDAIKICYIRHKFPPQDSRILPAEPGNDLTQLSLIFIPTKNTNRSTWNSELADLNGLVPTLCFCEPGKPDGDSTGHCPPNKPCQ